MLINSEVEINTAKLTFTIHQIRKIRGKCTFLKAFMYNAL